MARPDLGMKRVCPTTGRKFYDLNRDPIVSPYTGQEIPRSVFEPQTKAASGRAVAKPVEDEEELEVVAAGPEVVSLEDVAASEEDKADETADEAAGEEAETADDPFLEEEEEGGDVADLIENDLDEEEES